MDFPFVCEKEFLLFFTNKGKIHWLKAYQVPEANRYARGNSIANVLSLDEGEHVTALIPVKKFEQNENLFMITKKGIVKKTPIDQFSKPRKGGILAVGLNEGDELVSVLKTKGNDLIFLATEKGNAVKFHEKEVRPMGRGASGVRGIKLRDDNVIEGAIAEDNKTILTITEKGYGKRTPLSDYRQTSRGGVGVINLKITEKNGKVAAVKQVTENTELMITTQKGITIRMNANQISSTGRNTQGVRVIRLGEGDKVVSTTTFYS